MAGFVSSRTTMTVIMAMMPPTMTTTSTELDTTAASLPAPYAALASMSRPHRRWWAAGVAAAILVALAIAASTVELPYTVIMPGHATPVSDRIAVTGAPSYPPEESIAFTTVTARDATLFETLRGWIDDDIDVYPNEQLRGDRSEEENRALNSQMMVDSKLIARTVALRHLGYQVDVRLAGVAVDDLDPDFPAAAAGLERGDVILGVDGEAVDQHDELPALLQVGGVGTEHTLNVHRLNGDVDDVRVTTVASPDDATRAIIGIQPVERVSDFEFPIDVTIDSGAVLGPSAGLAFTLAVIDVLTEGELTGGHKVATTGTMELDGTVGPVGGARQKAVTVRNAGYEVFLVPSLEYGVVEDAIGADVQVIAVDTLAEALDALASLGGNAASLEPAVGAAA
jgi:PDZ domain-containing protein